MANLNQKVVGNSFKTEKKYDLEPDNLGLDADHSSENSGRHINLNNDNDRISHNPDGEDDDHDNTEDIGHSPLMDK